MSTILEARPRSPRFRAVFAAVAVAVLAGSMIAPSFAADRDHHDRRPVRHYHHAPPGPAYGYDVPGYVQAPPPVVYAPPVYATPFSLNFNIR